MVGLQQRQLRKTHMDAHYAACVYRYIKEFAVLHKDQCLMLAMDDKAKVPVGELGFPLAAVTQGRKVVVGENQVFQVGDHDFSQMSFIPSVTLVTDIPDEADELFLLLE